jgi:tetratricopeptide (TPR) repeat protein
MVVVLIIVVLTAYYQATHHEFISYDDEAYITDNAHIKEGVNCNSIRWAFTSLDVSNWHPVTWISHMIDYSMYGSDPYGHHLSNIILHILNAALLFCLLYFTTKNYWASYFVSALFALHPLHVESVAWAAERKDVLSTFFLMLTLTSYSAYVKKDNRKFYYVAIVLFAVGLMSKPMLVTLPAIMLLWDFWPLERFENSAQVFPKLMREKIPFLLLALLSSAVTYYAQDKGGALSSLDATPPLLRTANAFAVYISYLLKTVWPSNLAIIYPLPDKAPVLQGTIAALSIIVISITAYRAGGKHPYLITGWFWYLISLAPVIGIVQVGLQSMADRYTYVTLIGIFIVIAWGVPELLAHFQYKKEFLSVSATLVLATLTLLTWRQLGYWENSITLFRHAVQVTDNNNIAYRILGNNLARRGQVAEAMVCLSEAVRIKPDDPIAQTDLGVALAEQKSYDAAIVHYVKAIRVNPRMANAYFNLGVALQNEHRYEEAIDNYREALRLEPGKPSARSNLGMALFMLGRYDEAIYYFQDELRNYPNNRAAEQFLDYALKVKSSVQSK